MLATSEQNSHGITQGKWFDGKMERCSDTRNPYWSSWPNWRYQYELKVSEIVEVFNLDHICSRDSYYQCLAKRFRRFNFNTAPIYAVKGSKCNFDRLCTPFSLPSNAEDQIPVCTNEIDKACYGHILMQLDSNQTKHCKKSCHVKQYAVKEYATGKENEDSKKLVINLSYDIKLRRDVSESTWDLRALEPSKTVKTEYWIMSSLSFVGNVGGTLGMFVGFSFIGTSEWCFDLLGTFWSRLQKKLDYQKSKQHIV